MKRILLIFLCILFAIVSKAQITKKTLLFGGSIGFSATKNFANTGHSTTNEIKVAGNVGYFIIDKVVIGLVPDMNFSFHKSVTGEHESGYYSLLGPFVRYYVLSIHQSTNLFLQGSYSIGIIKIPSLDAWKYHTASFSVGAEIFLTSAVGLEISIGYTTDKSNNNVNSYSNVLQSGIGFQFHFKKHQ